jgi:hypothetical protein
VDPITKHHYDNIRNNKTLRDKNGKTTTVRTVIVGDGEREYLIPTLWDGKILSEEEALKRALESGTDWPSAPAGAAGVARLEDLDMKIHEGLTDTTTPKEAEDIILRGAPTPNDDLIGREISPRPKMRPSLKLPYEDIEKIERVVWDEARGEGVEGRNAVRGVIFNRLMSDRFPDTVDEVLSGDEFEGVGTYGSVSKIPVPDEELATQMDEFTDYVQLGEDASGGRTFFQNKAKTKKRGTDFSGPDPMTVGNHTFTRGYGNQEPVYDVNFSHDVEIVYPEYAQSDFALGGLAVARKGIMTPEGEDMANKKFQLDENKADLNNDGNLSSYEKQRAEAIQKADADEIEMYHGGMMGPVDPVSGNEIPIGSSAEEVRDDIEINISQGEYVLPADVVKWHGLKHILDMQEEAKMGLMAMNAMGLIKGSDEEAEEMVTECPLCQGAGCEECEGEEDMIETPEGEEVEVASVEVSEEEPEVNETEEYAESDYSKKTSMFGMVKKPKITFIV